MNWNKRKSRAQTRDKCRKHGHLLRFVAYTRHFNRQHSPHCKEHWPKTAWGECARCGSIELYNVSAPASCRSPCTCFE